MVADEGQFLNAGGADDARSSLEFFGFREQPFAPTADPIYFYATRSHKECLFRLWRSVDERNGIAAVLGNYGTGKTTLLRKLLTGMAAEPHRYNTAVIGSPIPSWTSFALLEAIISQFDLKPERRSFVSYMEALNRYLVKNRDRVCTLIIDDAQNLNKRGQIELLRLVQNLETPQHKLLNLVLFAQLEWIDVLQAAPNFEQRINMTFTLAALRFEDVRSFIEFRIRQAGGVDDRVPYFDEGALQAIYAYSDGSPRVVVSLCRNAMLVAAQIKTRRIGQDLILHTIEKTTVPDPKKRARVAEAVLKIAGRGPVAPRSDGGESAVRVPEARRRRHSHEDRASRMLLRAVKSKQAEG